MTTEASPPAEGEVRGRWTFASSVHTPASKEDLWPLIGEAGRWREWSWMTRTYLLRPGHSHPEGVGALRRFGMGPGGSTEEVVAWDPPRHLGYRAVKGLPVRRYHADVLLESDDHGTTITWSGAFDPLIPGSGGLLRVVLRRLTRGFAVRLARYAERTAKG
jgi:hypothetical protein